MKNERNALLAGFAALALLAGSGLALAQGSSNEQNGAAQTKERHATPSMKHGQAYGKMGEGRENKEAGASRRTEHNAQGNVKNGERLGERHERMEKKHVQEINRGNKTNKRTTERYRPGTMQGGATAEQMGQGNNLRGLQGNATGQRGVRGANVTLTEQQRMSIRNTVIEAQGAPRLGRVNFGVRVGRMVPRRIHILPVPETLVEIDPSWSGLEYFVFRDEVVIVDPNTMRIVAIVPA